MNLVICFIAKSEEEHAWKEDIERNSLILFVCVN